MSEKSTHKLIFGAGEALAFPIPHKDNDRVEALLGYAVLDTPKEESFDALTNLAARIFDVSISLVSLVDENRQWFKSAYGLGVNQTPRSDSFCAYAIMGSEPLVVLDATLDERFKNNALVTGEPYIRFYAGAPLVNAEGYSIGSLCIIDTKPRDTFRQFELDNLIGFADAVMAILEMRRRMMIGVGEHITDLNKAHDEKDIIRQEAAKSKSEFISTISHELRTPLTSIKGALGLIQAGAFDNVPEKLPSVIDIACKNAEQLNNIIDDILDTERLNVGKMSFQMSSTDLSVLLKEAVLSNDAYGNQYGVTFSCNGIEEPLLVNGDHNRLMQVMANLLSNAAKFSSRGGLVEVSVVRYEGNLRISVKDHGCGIPKAARETIFDKFTQVDSPGHQKKGGSGLGLSIAKMIVEAHNGHINFTSELDKGTTFYFDLPELVISDVEKILL